MAQESRFNISLRDLKRDCVERMLQEVVSRDLGRSKMAAKEEDEDEDRDEDEGVEETENDKLVRLQQETKGKPSPIPVVDEDFSEKAVKAAMKKVPDSPKKRGKA